MRAKKTICAAVVAASMLALAACSGGGDATTAAPETTVAETEAPTETEAPAETTAAPEETEAAADGLKAGTYEATAKGFAGDVKVSITIGDDGTITACEVDASGETQLEGVGWTADKVKEAVEAEILASGDGSLDAISSVSLTGTGPAALDALKDCLAQAQQ